MSASKVNPNMYNDAERSGGYITKNEKPTSTSSPEWRGKLYLEGVGWYWLSAWVRETKGGPLLSLRAQEMTDEQAAKFCAPRGKTSKKPAPRQPNVIAGNGAGRADSDIPF